MGTSTTSTWTASDYATTTTVDDTDVTTGITGTGAAKLACSAVAPLVAAARGYRTVDQSNVRDIALALGMPDMRTAAAQQLNRLVTGSDAMLMPWTSLLHLADDPAQTPATTHQLRPGIARADPKTGRLLKYVLLAGQTSPLDVHPSTPRSWLNTAPRIAFVEGLLKADSFLTALLLNTGLDPTSDLAWPEEQTDPHAARRRLRELLDQIPPEDATLVVSLVGVGNWHRNAEWSVLDATGRSAMVAFDGDIATNWNVWNQAEQIFTLLESKRAARVDLIDLSAQPLVAGEKVGIDDFLAQGHTINDVLALLTPTLPDRPPRPIELEVGRWRVSETQDTVEECIADTDAAGNPSGAHWETRVRIGGRVTSVGTYRWPTDEEMKTGLLRTDDDGSEESLAEYELTWRDETTGAIRHATVTGPDTILEVNPREWHRHKAAIPASVKVLPDWPPRKGEEWLAAIKAHRAEEIEHRTSWSRMGWVPAEGGPVFIVGDQVVGAHGLAPQSATPGVTEKVLPKAGRFGVQMYDPGLDEDELRAAVAKDVQDVFDAYITSGAFTNPGIASAVLCAMIRPTLPVGTRVPIYFTGPPGRGKSFGSSMCMAGWQPHPGIWNENHLPGGAQDTTASIEHAVARTPIWVTDDVAPSPDPIEARENAKSMANLIRAIHNATSKRRMNGVEMTARQTPDPHALMIITAENENEVRSVRDRLVTLHIGAGSLGSRAATDRLVHLRDRDGAPARVVGAMIQHVARRAEREGWSVMRASLLAEMEARTTELNTKLLADSGDPGGASRHSKLVADLGLGLSVLGDLGEWAGLRGFKIRTLRLLYPLAEMMSANHADRAQSSPGAATIEAISKLLSSGQAHIRGADPTTTPLADSPTSETNSLLGWALHSDIPAPRGVCIGYLVTSPKTGDPVVLLEARVAFDEAAKRFRDLIPHGSTSAGAWADADAAGLLNKDWARHGNGKKRTSVVRAQNRRGVPVDLKILLHGGLDPDAQTPTDDEQEVAA